MPCFPSLPSEGAVTQRAPPVVRISLSQRCAIITPPSPPADIHGVSHPESAAPSPTCAVVSDAGARAVAPAGVQAAPGGLAPRPCGGGLHYNGEPMCAGGIAGGSQ